MGRLPLDKISTIVVAWFYGRRSHPLGQMATVESTSKISHLSVPDSITSAKAKLIYVYLQARGEVTQDQLRDDLGITMVALLGIVKRLEAENLVERDGETIRPC